MKKIVVRVYEGLALCTVVAWWGADGSDRELGDGQRAANITFTVGEHYCRLFVFVFRWWASEVSNRIPSTAGYGVCISLHVFRFES